jgi:cytosine/adenosine deaminase-related metal-dependent hydrolase
LAKRLSEPIVVGGVVLRPGMPLTELTPQLPQLAAQVTSLAEEIISADGGNRLLDDLAKAAVAGTTAGEPAAQLSMPALPSMHTHRLPMSPTSPPPLQPPICT